MSEVLDRFVRIGAGDPRAALAGSRPFLANEQLLDLVLALRHHNDRGSGAPVRVVHGGADDLSSPAALESSLAHQLTEWRERYGDRVVYLGGAVHTAVATRRTSDSPNVVTAGSLIRSHLGARYVSVGLTFGSGAIPQDVPNPPPTSLEARLDSVPHGTFLLEPHGPSNEAWLGDTDRIRVVGPGYDPVDDVNHTMKGDPRTWFDVLVHQRIAKSVNFLT
jgi:erythromycin esterase